MSQTTIQLTLTQQQDYRFLITFAEPVPPLLAASVGNCLSDSLLFALRKFKQNPEPLHTRVQAEVGRNAEGRLRVLAMAVELHLGVPAAQLEHLQRVLDSFEQYCTVTQTVATAVDISVQVFDSTGQRCK